MNRNKNEQLSNMGLSCFRIIIIESTLFKHNDKKGNCTGTQYAGNKDLS